MWKDVSLLPLPCCLSGLSEDWRLRIGEQTQERKKSFVETFTRDLSAEEAGKDLIPCVWVRILEWSLRSMRNSENGRLG